MIVSFYELGMVTEEDLAEALDGLRSRPAKQAKARSG